MRERKKPLAQATSANAQKLMDFEQRGQLDAYKNNEKSLIWLKDVNIKDTTSQ